MKKNEPQEQPIFDDALPEQLLEVNPEKTGSSLRLKVNGPVSPSPFVVRLTRENESPKPVPDPVLELAKSLVYEPEEDEDEAPLVEVDDVLNITSHELRSQLMERDTVLPEIERVAIPVVLASSPKEEIVMPAALPVVSANILEEFVFDAEELEPAPFVANTSDSVVLVELPEETPEPQTSHPQPQTIVRLSWSRAWASFVAIALLLVLPLQVLQVFASTAGSTGEITNEGEAALDSFLRGATSLSEKRFTTAGEDFSRAAEEFKNVEDSLDDMHAAVVAVVNVIPQTERTMSSVRGLVTAGQELSETAGVLALAGEDITSQKSIDLVTKLALLSAYIENAEPHVKAASLALQDVDPEVIPDEYTERVGELKAKVPKIHAAFKEYLLFTDALSVVLGGEEKVKYLAAFQNNTELRPTGGFVGSFAEVDVKDGAIENLSVPGGGSYAMQGQLTKFVAAPGPLQLLKARWEFQDANWFPDFPTSAEKLLWFSDHSGGPTMDGVVAVNATFVQELLKVLGPVEMPAYGRTIDAENFLLETQKIVELEYDREENAPKAFIGDLAPILLERITEADLPTLLSVLELVGRALEEKDIMVYFSNNEVEAAMERLGWSGSVKDTSGDYLMVVNTNLGGGKTDGVIDQEVDVKVEVGEDGSIENTVTITKTHRGMKSALFNGVNNVDYLRLYVPKGSELISATGFETPGDELFETSEVPLEVDEDLAFSMQDLRKDAATDTDVWEEEGKTVFGNWMQTAPGETEVVTFTYRLPFKLSLENQASFFGGSEAQPYSLFVQKQPGVVSRMTNVEVVLPHSVKVLWSSGSANQNLTAQSNNNTDAFFGWLLERE